MTGNIDVFAGGTYDDPNDPGSKVGILLQAGNRRSFHAMIGHCGTNHRADLGAQTIDFGAGAILPSGFITPTLAASTGFNWNIRVEADQGDFIAAGGDNFRADRVWGFGFNFVQVGHGGDTVRGAKGGAITVLAGQGQGLPTGTSVLPQVACIVNMLNSVMAVMIPMGTYSGRTIPRKSL